VAKLILKFEQSVLKEVPLSQGVVTIGRLPDNVVHIDNLAVSGHHAKISWEQDKYVIEDNNSLNGTYVNKHRVSKAALKEGDEILVGKHTLSFKEERHEGAPAGAAPQHKGPAVPQMQATMMLDTKKAKEMLAMAAAARTGGAQGTPTPQAAPAPSQFEPPTPPKERIGTFIVLAGKTDAKNYVIGKMCVIGKSDMASIKLKGFFAPTMAALINKRDGKYFIAASEAKIKVKINGQEIAGQKEMNEGDIVEVAGVKLTFGYQE
jgi:pSer/pThr/pTyr-binding forkhead associated (FHA) protein